MASEWLKLTPADGRRGDSVYVNLANATSIWSHNQGSQIWFFADEAFGKFDVKETPEHIVAMRSSPKNADRP
jgi:hypothetical protein